MYHEIIAESTATRNAMFKVIRSDTKIAMQKWYFQFPDTVFISAIVSMCTYICFNTKVATDADYILIIHSKQLNHQLTD